MDIGSYRGTYIVSTYLQFTLSDVSIELHEHVVALNYLVVTLYG